MEIFTEVVIAPGADDAAREVFSAKKNLRLLTTEGLADTDVAPADRRKQVTGGWLVQDKDAGQINRRGGASRCHGKRAPTEAADGRSAALPGRWPST